MDRKEIGGVMAKMRKAKRLNQTELASRLGVSQGRVSQIETEGPAKTQVMVDWADACGYDLFVSWRSRSSGQVAVPDNVRRLLYR
jgi:transcriptional regulator with XRE-family HTH domain